MLKFLAAIAAALKSALPAPLLLALVAAAGWPGGLALAQSQAATPTIRIGVLKFGTVNWALSVLQARELDKMAGIALEIVPLANDNATVVALQGGAVDMIVKDWIWVARQRAEGKNFTFAPYSLAVGSLLVRPEAGIDDLAGLAGKRLGVAGGPVDKSWLLLRAYAQQTLGKDLTELVEPSFGAPPLLNELAFKGELDAVLNFWHFAARLKANGLTELISVAEILPKLGVEGEVPLLGWVFEESWGEQNRAAVEGFLHAARRATRLMKTDDGLWTDMLRPLTRAEDEATLMALRDGFRAGVPERFGDAEKEAARQVFTILARLGGDDLVGQAKGLDSDTFWPGYAF